MNKIKKFLSKYWIFILLSLIATILGGFYLKNKISPKEKLPEALQSISSPIIPSYPVSISPETSTLQKNFPSFEKKINVYQASSFSFSDQEALKISQALGFTEKPIVSRDENNKVTYNWYEEENFLIIHLYEGRISYGLNFPLKEVEKKPLPSLSEAEIEFKEFLKKNNLMPPNEIELEIKDEYYAKVVGSFFEKTNPEDKEVSLLHFEYEYKINNKKIKEASLYPSINLYLASDFKIVKFDYYNFFNKINYLSSYPLKTLNEVIQDIKKSPRISYLLLAGTDDPIIFSPEELKQLITNLTFDNIELVYYKYDPLQSYLQPVFLITGKARLKDGQEGEVGLYLPAIKEEYLLK